ncbi:MAG: type II toxin-antitoxin system RatA family toxin [Xanthomonadales bacterium]|nr:type II toxin-antitoxin system RatA family toxin [Xanthomonadales bacterium]
MKIIRSALVTYSAMDMYRLVKGVPSYPQFLSWCTSTQVHEQNSEFQKASLTVVVAGIRQSFTTNNTLYTGEKVEMRLLEGPFKKLQGEWRFIQLGEDGCKISLELDFEMNKGPMATMFGKGFGKIADRLVDDFCKRAEKVYPL